VAEAVAMQSGCGGRYRRIEDSGVPWMLSTALAVLLAGCASPLSPFQAPAQAPAPARPSSAPAAAGSAPASAPAPLPPPSTPRDIEAAGQRDLDEGIALYDKGDYNAAIERLANSEAIHAAPLPIRVSALKYSAFSFCVSRRASQCRAQFEAAFKLDPAFDLLPGEHGHPLWGPVFDRVKKAHPATATKK
jgi:hypothetical protein